MKITHCEINNVIRWKILLLFLCLKCNNCIIYGLYYFVSSLDEHQRKVGSSKVNVNDRNNSTKHKINDK